MDWIGGKDMINLNGIFPKPHSEALNHRAWLDVGGRIRCYPISDKAYDNLMRTPWNTPVHFMGEVFSPDVRGYKIVMVD